MDKKKESSEETEVFAHPSKEVQKDHYEILLLIAQDFTTEQADAIFAEVKGFVTAVEGTIVAERPMGRKPLAYRVNGGNTGTYFALECEIPKPEVAVVHEKMRIRKDIARFMIVKKEVMTPEEKEAYETLREQLMSEGKAEREQEEADQKPAKAKPAPAAVAEEPVKEEIEETKKTEEASDDGIASKKEINDQIDKILSDDIEV